ncbi:phospholipase [Amycolatopsis anabasis]|uniref:phospholipase n=1 Tax=Amycolatopsis anabasis TaxID=1840409 RepID=UPI00131D85F3|nr:phospholipase [Amycolatopsis anabasis]
MTTAADALPPVPRAVRRPLWTSAWLLLLTLAVLGFGVVASRPAVLPDHGAPTGGPAAAQHAIEALLAPGPSADALTRLPADFTQVTGIVPGAMPARDGTVRAVHVDGGCSTPWGDDNTKWDYAVPCKAHDLGYDLLRYADRMGQPLAPWVREALDDRLSTDMHATCGINPMNSPGTCDVVASLYSAGLVVNSWHQRWGPPIGEPIGPMLAGVAVIACLLAFRLRGWLRVRRAGPRVAVQARAVATDRARPWAFLGVASVVLLILGESAIALARWAGADESWLWPLTWLAQLAPLFFFAGGRANAAGWRAARAAGGGYRQYLAHRASWLLRPALIFVVVALVVPMALELLGIPPGTNTTVMRIALHPLWLLGVYLLTVVATPVLLALHRRAAVLTPLALLALVVGAELSASWTDSQLPRYAGALGLALLAQQAAFGHARPRTRSLVLGVLIGLTALVLLVTLGGASANLLGAPGAPPALAAETLPVLALGLAQLCLFGLCARPLARLAAHIRVARAVRFALRAPMSLYLGFLAAMLALVTIVYLPGRLDDDLAWLTQPRSLMAFALLAVPAAAVFWWFERHTDGHAPAQPGEYRPAGRLGAVLGHSAVGLGIGYATVGVFGFALTRFGVDTFLFGLRLNPIQNLVLLLLGVFLLHAARIGASSATSTWVVTGLACVPALLSAADGETGPLTVAVPAVTAALAVAAAAGTVWQARSTGRSTAPA